MISIPILLLLLLLHWIGDFVIRPRDFARSELRWRTLHALVYAAIILFGYGTVQWFGQQLPPSLSWRWPVPSPLWFFPAIMVMHLMCDLMTNGLMRTYQHGGRPYNYCLTIGTDQLVHQLCLICTFDTLTRLWL